jgi:hypothetical protein
MSFCWHHYSDYYRCTRLGLILAKNISSDQDNCSSEKKKCHQPLQDEMTISQQVLTEHVPFSRQLFVLGSFGASRNLPSSLIRMISIARFPKRSCEVRFRLPEAELRGV